VVRQRTTEYDTGIDFLLEEIRNANVPETPPTGGEVEHELEESPMDFYKALFEAEKPFTGIHRLLNWMALHA
jgi:hypothetical protein